MSWRATLLLAALSLGCGGCFTAKKTFVMPPTPRQIAAKPLPKPILIDPPAIETPLQDIEIPRVELAALPSPAPVSPQQPRRARVTPPTASPGAAPGPTLPTPEIETPVPGLAPAAPQLSEILTDDRRKQYEEDFARSVAGARAALDRASGRRKLTARQQQSVDRIKAFLKQAEESRGKDLAVAFELARRAELFGRDLLKSLQ
ncbi:MAG TPA: hypothetical protein VGL72_05225 [Bryobacteraceae bacterium]|jgi:hypothetical protein